MKIILFSIALISFLLFIDSISTHFVFNKRINEIRVLESKVRDLTSERDKLKTENSKLINDVNSLRIENSYLKSVKTIYVPQREIIEYGNQELMDQVEELESERDELQNEKDELESENEDLRGTIDDDY